MWEGTRIRERENILRLTLAKISIQRIRVERRWAHALARLYALLVSLAFVVIRTSLLRGRTEPVVWVAAVAVRAHALMSTRQIDALGAISTNLMSHGALIDI